MWRREMRGAHHKSQPEGRALRAQDSLNLIRVNRGALSPHPLSLSQRERDLECAGLDGALDLPKSQSKENWNKSSQVRKFAKGRYVCEINGALSLQIVVKEKDKSRRRSHMLSLKLNKKVIFVAGLFLIGMGASSTIGEIGRAHV